MSPVSEVDEVSDRDEAIARACAEVAAARRTKPPRSRGGRPRVLRAIGEFLVEAVGEVVVGSIVAGVSLGLFAGVVALVVWGFSVSPVVTVVFTGGVAVFLALGVREVFVRKRRDRLGKLLVAAGVFTILWVLGLIVSSL